jgi:hypothetical protein
MAKRPDAYDRRVPTRKKASPKPPALTADDVSWLRSQVGGGDKPPVIVRAASAAVPAGTRGHVIRMGPPSEGEFIVVRLGRDEVPFAPAELALSPRARSASRTVPAKAAPAKAAPAKTAAAKSVTTKRTTAKVAKRPAKATPGKSSPAKAAPAKAAPAKSTNAPKARRRTSSRGAAQPLTVTVRYADGRWTVEAQRGSRRLAKPSLLRPGAVKTFADLVDDEAIHAAITGIVESGRAVIEQRAEKLRLELQAAEDSLRDYEARRR